MNALPGRVPVEVPIEASAQTPVKAKVEATALDGGLPVNAATARDVMREAIGRIATGPEYSRDLSLEQARDAMRLVLQGRCDPVQSAVFLVALRMKRETDEENIGLLSAIREASHTATVDAPEIVDIADPYDGYIKGLPASTFLPALLAACGLPAVCHGVVSIGPKHGLTHAQVLAACGVPTDLEPTAAAQMVDRDDVGWSYADQAQYCPALCDLSALRELIVKRPALSTIETLVGPIRGRRVTHLLTGFVHKAYPRVYALLARAAGFDSALIVRGMEGGVLPSLRQPGRGLRYSRDAAEHEVSFDPVSLGINQDVRMPPVPPDMPTPLEPESNGARADRTALAAAAARAGLLALQGQAGPMHDALVYGAALVLWHTGRASSLSSGASSARRALDAGDALAHFRAAIRDNPPSDIQTPC